MEKTALANRSPVFLTLLISSACLLIELLESARYLREMFTVTDPDSLWRHLAQARHVAKDSPHSDHQIGAVLFGEDRTGKAIGLSFTNAIPKGLIPLWNPSGKIGGCGPTIHAETWALLKAPAMRRAFIALTDPPCPACMKNMVSAGIEAVFVDGAGFEQSWAEKNAHYFHDLSIPIAQKGGVSLFRTDPRTKTIKPLVEPLHRNRPEEKPVFLEVCKAFPTDGEIVERAVQTGKDGLDGRSGAAVIGKDSSGKPVLLSAGASLSDGFSALEDKALIESVADGGKHDFVMDPLLRLLVSAPFLGVCLEGGTLACSYAPPSAAFVDALGCGLKRAVLPQKETRSEMTGFLSANGLMEIVGDFASTS